MPKSTKAKLEYQRAYNARPEQQDKNTEYKANRRAALKTGKVSVGDGMDIAHKVALDSGGSNAKSNTLIQPAATNRGWRKASGYRVPQVK